jgi:hypothetical protein
MTAGSWTTRCRQSEKSNIDNAAMLVQSQRLCMLLEASPTEEALVLVSASPSSEVPAAWPWMTKLLAGPGGPRGEGVDKSARGRRLRRHPLRRPMVGAA